ncbi:MAG: hypothetical protein AB1586_06865 [Pseudomonadota bacterium]|jgi:hypothetical protein
MLSLALHLGRRLVRHPAVVHETRLIAHLLLSAATRLVAGALHIPDTTVRDTGAFVAAYVTAVEQRATLVCRTRSSCNSAASSFRNLAFIKHTRIIKLLVS